MNARSGPLSDLEQATSLSRKLSDCRASASNASGSTQFVSFGKPPSSIYVLPPSLMPMSQADAPPAPPATTFDTWEGLLSWCMQCTQTEMAFATTSQGSVLGVVGQVPGAGLGAMGSNLRAAIEQLGQIHWEDGPLRSVFLQFRGRWLMALCVPIEGQGDGLIGMVGPEPVGAGTMQAIYQTLANSLSLLR